MSADIRLVPGVFVERVGDDVVVLVPGRDESLRFSGDHANTVDAISRGDTRGVDAEIFDQLVQFGVVIAPGLSRRGLVRAGAIGAGAGIALLSLPGVAAASSGPTCENPDFVGNYEDPEEVSVLVDEQLYDAAGDDSPDLFLAGTNTLISDTFGRSGGAPYALYWEFDDELDMDESLCAQFTVGGRTYIVRFDPIDDL